MILWNNDDQIFCYWHWPFIMVKFQSFKFQNIQKHSWWWQSLLNITSKFAWTDAFLHAKLVINNLYKTYSNNILIISNCCPNKLLQFSQYKTTQLYHSTVSLGQMSGSSIVQLGPLLWVSQGLNQGVSWVAVLSKGSIWINLLPSSCRLLAKFSPWNCRTEVSLLSLLAPKASLFSALSNGTSNPSDASYLWCSLLPLLSDFWIKGPCD